METVHEYSQVKGYGDSSNGLMWDHGYVYQLLLCPACSGICLRRYYWHEFQDPEEIALEVLFPTEADVPPGLPEVIEREYLAALRVRNMSPNAYGVLLGRLLELVCEDRGAHGGNVVARLRDLVQRNEIPSRLVDVALSLQQFRNVAAHATAGELTQAEVPTLDKLCRAVLEYVYGAPSLLRQAEEQLALLKRVRGSKSGGSQKAEQQA